MINATMPPITNEKLLADPYGILRAIETVLIHLSPTTRDEISRILADDDDNQSGVGPLIDQVQITANRINRHNHHN